MPASTYVRSTSSNSTGASTASSLTVTLPTGAAGGDELLLIMSSQNSAGTTGPFVNPGGWVPLASTPLHQPSGGGANTMEVGLYRAQLGTDVTGTSWVFTWTPGSSYYAWVCTSLFGSLLVPGGPVAVGTPAVGTTSATIAPSITAAGELVMGVAAFAGAIASAGSFSAGWVTEGSAGAGRCMACIGADNTAPDSGTLTPTITDSGTAQSSSWATLLRYGIAAGSPRLRTVTRVAQLRAANF